MRKIKHISKGWIISFAIVGVVLLLMGVLFHFNGILEYGALSFLGIFLCAVAYILFIQNKHKKDFIKSMKATETNIPEKEPQGEVDYQAIHDEMYYVEYKLIPHFVEFFNDQPEKASQIVISIYENLITLQNNLRKVNPIAFGNISCEVCGDLEKESLVVYEFPRPFDMPLAKYGAIYINKPQQKYQYWTLEFSLNNHFVIGSTTKERHTNYGQRADLSKDEFIQEVCKIMGVDESTLQPRNKVCRKHMLELNDRIFKDAIDNCPFLVVCFYDFNQPSQLLIPIMEQLAQEYRGKIMVGVYDVYGGVECLSSSSNYSVRALPTVLFFAYGEVVDKHIGVCNIEVLKAKFEKMLMNDANLVIK